MIERFLELLACPLDGEGLSWRGSPGEEGGIVYEASLACGRGHRFPVVDGVPRLTPASELSGSEPASRPAPAAEAVRVRSRFEDQWSTFGKEEKIFGKDRAAMRELITGPRIGGKIDAAFYPGKTVLDAGCGHGRYVIEFARLGARAVGLDAGGHLGGVLASVPAALRDKILLVQGDLLFSPFRADRFDLVFCDGVLHHTLDPREGFRGLARVAGRDGAVYVWVYPRGGRAWELSNRALRSVTTRLPSSLLKGLCYALAPALAVVPTYSGTRPGNASWRQCAQVVFDWLAPSLQSHHTPEEVEGWFRDEKLEDLEALPVPVGWIGWKRTRGPARGPAS